MSVPSAEVVRGLLLDSGDTVMRPRGDRWNPRFDFESVLAAHFPGLGSVDLAPAFAAGDAFLARSASSTATDYTRYRADYHRAILAELGIDDPATSLLEALDAPMPFSELVGPFEDAEEWLPRLRDLVDGMAIVADTGSAMRDVYRDNRLDGWFDVFVISGELGCTKPDPRMYATASEALGLTPSECLFVDDNPENVTAALALGYQACGISRYHEPPDDGLTWVRDLPQLHALLSDLRVRS